jgi:dynein heavy chain, axonemal
MQKLWANEASRVF